MAQFQLSVEKLYSIFCMSVCHSSTTMVSDENRTFMETERGQLSYTSLNAILGKLN